MKDLNETDRALRDLLISHPSRFPRAGLFSHEEGDRMLIWSSHPMAPEPPRPRDPGLQALETSPFEDSSEQAFFLELEGEPSGAYGFYFELSVSPMPLECITVLVEMGALAKSTYWRSCASIFQDLLEVQRRVFAKALHRGLAQELTIARLEVRTAGCGPESSPELKSALKRCAEELRSLLHDRLRPRSRANSEGLKQGLFDQLSVLSRLGSTVPENPGHKVFLSKEFVSPTLVSLWSELGGTIVERNEDSYEIIW